MRPTNPSTSPARRRVVRPGQSVPRRGDVLARLARVDSGEVDIRVYAAYDRAEGH